MTRNLLLILTIILAVAIAGYTSQYLNFETTGFLKNKPVELATNYLWLTAFYLHVFPGAIAVLLGGTQFIVWLRERFTFVHRKLGVVYVTCVFIASMAGLALAIFAEGGLTAKVGFAGLAILWFYSNYRAYTAIRKGQIVEHRSWMIRNYALTFAAVTLRIWLPLMLGALQWKFSFAYPIVAWLCWVPNLLVAELIVWRVRSLSIVAASPQTAIGVAAD